MDESLHDLILRVPFFRTLDRVDVARLIGILERVSFAAGTSIFQEGADADALYLLESGQVAITIKAPDGDRTVTRLSPPAYFGELGLLLARRTASAIAVTDVQGWKLPRGHFEELARERNPLSLAMAASLAELIDQRSREHLGAPSAATVRPPASFVSSPVAYSLKWRIAGATFAVGVPLALWWVRPPGGLSLAGWHVNLVLLGAALGWLSEPVPDFVIALAMVAAWGIVGLVPVGLAFAGFTSPSWVVAVGALGLAAAMVRSGLFFRIALFFLKNFPATHVGQVVALLASGAILTPLVPLGIARVATIAPLTQELAQGLGYRAKSRASAGIAFAGLVGYGGFSSIFLTGLAMNFFVLDLLPRAERIRFDWLTWLAAAALAGAVMLIGAVFILLVVFRPEVTSKATTAAILKEQERALGRLSRQELATIGAVALLLVGLLLQSILHIDTAWLAICALILTVAGGVLNRGSFRSSIDWGFLTLFGILLGTGGVLHSVGIDRWIADILGSLTAITGNSGVLLLLLGLCVVACRLVLPWIPATLLLSLALVPAAAHLGLSPWVVGFVVLVTANTWLLPGQSDFCRLMRDATKGEMFAGRHVFVLGIIQTLVTLAAITASVPYWRALGLLAR